MLYHLLPPSPEREALPWERWSLEIPYLIRAMEYRCISVGGGYWLQDHLADDPMGVPSANCRSPYRHHQKPQKPQTPAVVSSSWCPRKLRPRRRKRGRQKELIKRLLGFC